MRRWSGLDRAMKVAIVATVVLIALALVAMGFAADSLSDQCEGGWTEDTEGRVRQDSCGR